VRGLAACGGVGAPDDLPLASCVSHAVTDLKLHWENTNGARCFGRRHAGPIRRSRLNGLLVEELRLEARCCCLLEHLSDRG
jgi:hypothetical protein